MARIDRRGFDDEDPELMVSFGRELRAIAEKKGFVVLDGDRPRDEVHHDVWLACGDRFGDLPSSLGRW